jgi:hypothetical protein
MFRWDDISPSLWTDTKWFWEDEIYKTYLLLGRLGINIGDYYTIVKVLNVV